MLLHGDLHHDNILLAEDGTYKIIDPKGVVGDPVFDVSRFVLNEFDAEPTEPTYRKIVGILHVLSQNLQIPETILKQCLYVETTMGRLLVRGGRSGPRGISAIHQSRHVCRNGHECVMILDPCSIFQPLRF